MFAYILVDQWDHKVKTSLLQIPINQNGQNQAQKNNL